jgi:peroxiredoxin
MEGRYSLMFGVGDKAPDFTLKTADGEPIMLSQAPRDGHPVLLIFLRHLG